MEIYTKSFQTPNGPVEGVKIKWPTSSILLVTGGKGSLACPAIDVDAFLSFGEAVAIVESSSANPIGTLERFAERKIVKANDKAKSLGIIEGMLAKEAFALIA